MSSTTDTEHRFAYLLSPEFEIVNTAGKPLTGGWIEVYLHGTRNKYYCFSDFDGTLHPFQIPLDSLGSNIILASPLHAYDVYIYNKFGSLVMSRYNIVPATNSSDAIADIIVIDSPDDTIKVVVDGGTNWHLEVNTDLIATASGLEVASGNLQEQIDNKKDLQLPYAATGTVTKTITKIEQNENGEIEVTYADIDLPPQVPSIEITSPSGTLDIHSSTDTETNTKTFTIDVKDPYASFWRGYGSRVTASDTNLYNLPINTQSLSNQGNDITVNDAGKFVLKKGVYFYHGNVELEADTNTYNILQKINFSTGSNSSLFVWDRSTNSNQQITLNVCGIVNALNDGYVLEFNVSADTAAAFYAHLLEVDVFKINGVGNSSSGSDTSYIPGFGIEIHNDIIQVATGDIVTRNEFITTIQNVTGDITELSETVTNLIGATGDYATIEYVDNRLASATFEQQQSDWTQTDNTKVDYIKHKPNEVNLVAGNNIVIEQQGTDVIISATGISDDYGAGQYISIQNGTISVTGVQPEGDYATEQYVDEAVAAVTGQPFEQVNADWLATSGKAEILNKPQEEAVEFEEVNLTDYALASAIPDVSNFVTQQDINNSIAPVQSQIDTLVAATGDYITSLDGYATEQYVDAIVDTVTGMIPSDVVTHAELNDVVYTVTGMIPDVSNFVTQSDVDNTITPIQSEINDLVAATGDYLQSSDLNGYATEAYVDAAITSVSFEQVNSDWNATSGVAEILNRPEVLDVTISNLIAGDNISITPSGDDFIISAQGGGQGTNYTAGQYVSIANNTISVTGLQPEGNYATEQYVDSSVTGFATEADLQTVSGAIPESESVEFEELNLSDYALASAIPSLDGYATETYVDTSIATVTGNVVTEQELANAIDAATGLIPDTSNLATKTEVQTVDAKVDAVSAAIPSDAVTHTELSEAINAVTSAIPDVTTIETDIANLAAATGDYLQESDLSDYATEADLQTVSGAIPESEAVEFEELDLSNYALASAIPSLDGYATEAYVDAAVSAVSGGSFEQVNSDWTATSGVAEILNKPEVLDVTIGNLIPGDNISITASGDDFVISTNGGSGPSYTAGAGIDITNDAISVDNTVALKTDIPDVSNLASKSYVDTSIAAIPALSGTDGVTVEDNVVSLDNPVNLVAGDNVNITVSGDDVVISTQSGGASYTAGNGIDITNDVISINLTGITDVQVVQALPASPVATVLYLIPEA